MELDDLDEFADDDHPVLVDVIEASDERRQQAGAGLGREQSLVRGEDQRAVGLDPLFGEAAHRLEAFLAHRDLDDDVRGELGERAPFGEHPLDVLGDDLGGDRAAGDRADLLEDLLVGPAGGLGEQRRVGGHAVEHAPAGDGADLFDVRGVQEDLHGGRLRVRAGTSILAPPGPSPIASRAWRRAAGVRRPFPSDSQAERSYFEAPASAFTMPDAEEGRVATTAKAAGEVRIGWARAAPSGWPWIARRPRQLPGSSPGGSR